MNLEDYLLILSSGDDQKTAGGPNRHYVHHEPFEVMLWESTSQLELRTTCDNHDYMSVTDNWRALTTVMKNWCQLSSNHSNPWQPLGDYEWWYENKPILLYLGWPTSCKHGWIWEEKGLSQLNFTRERGTSQQKSQLNSVVSHQQLVSVVIEHKYPFLTHVWQWTMNHR